MVLGWVINGGEVGIKGIKRRGLGKGLGYWGAIRAGWEFLGTPPITSSCERVADWLAQTDFAQEPVFMACEDPTVSPLITFRNED
jgi:hypothetical protein